LIIIDVGIAIIAGVATSIGLFLIGIRFSKHRNRVIFSSRAIRKMEKGLPESLEALSSGLKAGFSLQQAIGELSKSSNVSLVPLYSLIITRIKAGFAIEEALGWAAGLFARPQIPLALHSMANAHRSGTNLIGSLDLLVKVTRDREALKKKMETMSAQGRMQGIVLSIVPLLFIVGLFVISPESLLPVFQNKTGKALLAISFLLQIMGAFVIRQLVNKEFL